MKGLAGQAHAQYKTWDISPNLPCRGCEGWSQEVLEKDQDPGGRRQRKQRRNTERQEDKWDLKCGMSDRRRHELGGRS